MFVLLTNRKSHSSLRLVPTLVTLNDSEQRIGRYFGYFTKFSIFGGALR